MITVMSTPIPARIHFAPGPAPASASRFQETPAIPVCRNSMPVKISPNPARIAPDDRSRPLAISQRKAPMPSMGSATDETLTPKPSNATIQGVVVVPSVAPTITPIAWGRVTSPALTKPMTVRLAAVEDWIAAVNSTPDRIALKWPPTSLCRVRRNASPARPFKPSVRWWMPSRNRPSPPTSVTAAAASMAQPPLPGLRRGPQYFAATNRLPASAAWSS
jgi:hypothetical protein